MTNPQEKKPKVGPENPYCNESVQKWVRTDHFADTFSRLGTELLERSERPTILTWAQFEPCLPLFKIDRERVEKDKDYRKMLSNLWRHWLRDLEVNLYFPVIVIESKENPREIFYVNRKFTRIKTPDVSKPPRIESVPPRVPKQSGITKEDLVIAADQADLVDANQTPEAMRYFATMRIETALFAKRFKDQQEGKHQTIASDTSSDSAPDTSEAPAVESHSQYGELED